ncbi:MAG: 50S ribosomal protein L25 [Verrucomicrobia bacterium]|nr:MAG: 50S ribosomal protein L25 [Verrucomicrobiota bacterium]
MKPLPLKAYPREAVGRNQVKHRRAAGRVPAILYGHHIQPKPLEVAETELTHLLHQTSSEVALVDLAVEGEPEPHLAIIKEVQHHPLSQKVIHVDFQAVVADEPVTVVVPVETVGEARGVKEGGVLEHIRHELTIRALPRQLPELLTVDVSNLGVDESITVADMTPPEGVEILEEPDVVVALVAALRAAAEEEVAPTAEGEEAAEPEVIARGKEAEETGGE